MPIPLGGAAPPAAAIPRASRSPSRRLPIGSRSRSRPPARRSQSISSSSCTRRHARRHVRSVEARRATGSAGSAGPADSGATLQAGSWQGDEARAVWAELRGLRQLPRLGTPPISPRSRPAAKAMPLARLRLVPRLVEPRLPDENEIAASARLAEETFERRSSKPSRTPRRSSRRPRSRSGLPEAARSLQGGLPEAARGLQGSLPEADRGLPGAARRSRPSRSRSRPGRSSASSFSDRGAPPFSGVLPANRSPPSSEPLADFEREPSHASEAKGPLEWWEEPSDDEQPRFPQGGSEVKAGGLSPRHALPITDPKSRRSIGDVDYWEWCRQHPCFGGWSDAEVLRTAWPQNHEQAIATALQVAPQEIKWADGKPLFTEALRKP